MKLLAFVCDRPGCGGFSSGSVLPPGWVERDDGQHWCASCAKGRRVASPERVLAVVAEAYQVGVARFDTEARDARSSAMRQVACLLLRRCTNLSLSEIAARVGRGHHTTALHAIRRAQEQCAVDVDYARWIDGLERAITER